MRHVKQPQQSSLFDSSDLVFSPKLKNDLITGWQGLFRMVILELMPVDIIGGYFDPIMGRPTKELYAMAGLILMAEFNNWTVEDTATAYRYRLDVQFALNLEPIAQELSTRTIERYRAIFIKSELAAKVMESVTACLIRETGNQVDRQRLDSTHVFSNMAQFGRTKLMTVGIKKFLTQLKRHDTPAYKALNEELRARYAPGSKYFFEGPKKDEKHWSRLRSQVAEDMYSLIGAFASNPSHANRSTYKIMVRIFNEQCEVKEDKIVVKEHPGGRIVVNPSDLDATLDGYKGVGYQVQIAETCHEDNEVELVTYGKVETAVESDSAALKPCLESLKNSERMPKELAGDTHYGSDENYTHAAKNGIDLVAPAPPGGSNRTKEGKLTLADFKTDPETVSVLACPEGHVPEFSRHYPESDTLSVKMGGACCRCPQEDRCIARCTLSGYYISGKGARIRLDIRRAYEQTEEFKTRYRIRSGIEATNSALKRKLGFGHLRVRGMPAVGRALLLKLAGWNILQASRSTIVKAKLLEKAKSLYIWTFYQYHASCSLRAHASTNFYGRVTFPAISIFNATKIINYSISA